MYDLRNIKAWWLHHLRLIGWILWWLSFICLMVALIAGWQWFTLSQRNEAMANPSSILSVHPLPAGEIWAYARGYAMQREPEQALQWFYPAENSAEVRLRTQAKFAIGNLYFDWAMLHHNIAQGGAHQQQVAMIALAKEAYKDALRLEPTFADARFNLELLDRRSPEKRTQGWLSETDGVTLKPFKRNGTAMMRDNQRRGLP